MCRQGAKLDVKSSISIHACATWPLHDLNYDYTWYISMLNVARFWPSFVFTQRNIEAANCIFKVVLIYIKDHFKDEFIGYTMSDESLNISLALDW